MKNQTKKQDSRFQQTSSIILNNDRFLIVANGQVLDSVAAATGLATLLTSMGKEVTLYSPQPLQQGNLSALTGTENFVENISGKSNQLKITLNCPLEDIEKVDSSEDNDRLSLKVEFRNQDKVIDASQVQVEQGVPQFDAGFVLGANWEEEIVNTGNWVYISRTGAKKDWAQVNVVESKGSISESLTSLVSRGNFQIPGSAAYNFYLGIKGATNNFDQADSIALETAAYCLRIKEKAEKQGQVQQPVEQSAEQAIDQPVEPKTEETPLSAVEAKEGQAPSEMGKPPVFTGKTTPKA
jgi:hypothetical protein